MNRTFYVLAASLCLSASATIVHSAETDPFAENIRTTEPLTPAEEQKTFQLPPGFEIELVTSEPNIRKPMNMAFDARGRLWVTESREYPIPAPLGKPSRDTIKIFEDTKGNGKYDKVSTFVDNLNIPTGVYPYKNGAIAWSIPNIWFFEDTDGDGKADKRNVLYGPLGWERDTHGLDSSFRRGQDGWMYATHGYNNNTTIHGRDGSEIKMNSGNIYRVRTDGSRVEQYTHGQVNPFGLCFDPLGNLYSADCHSSPIYQLLRGGYYPSFGKPDDGLGFAPTLMQHNHGSTAICGIIYYSDDTWPAEYLNNMFIGNVMTSRVNHDRLVEHGSTKIAIEAPDFVKTSDPWFRPVDLQYGPDGALYMSDFYNRIIGHYEVPLTHPGRDRERGRIWRIVYKGNKAKSPGLRHFDVSKADANELIREMGDRNPTRRSLALNELVDRLGAQARPDLEKAFSANPNPLQAGNILWALDRTGGVPEAMIARASADPSREVRTHLQKILSETKPWNESLRTLAVQGLDDPEAFVRRAAADALGQHPQFENIAPLLQIRAHVPEEDTHLLYVVRMALRNQLLPPENFQKLGKLSEAESRFIADVSVAIPSEPAAAFLLRHIGEYSEPTENLNRYLRHAARYAPAESTAAVAAFVQRTFPNDVDAQLSLFKAVQDGTAQRGAAVSPALTQWGESLTTALFHSLGEAGSDWRSSSVPGMPRTKNPWFLHQHASADGNRDAWFLCSLTPGGEQLTGVLKSKPFSVPAKLSFWIAGHDGIPSAPMQNRNFVRLRDAGTGATLAETRPPRNDLAQKVEWDLSKFQGKTAYLEFTDNNTGSGYAWLAVGRLDPSVVPFPKLSPNEIPQRVQSGAEIARALKLKSAVPLMSNLLNSGRVDAESAAMLGAAIASIRHDEPLLAMAPILGETDVPASLIQELRTAYSRPDDPAKLTQLIEETFRSTAYRIQLKLAQNLAATRDGAETLLANIENQRAPARLLQERSVHDKLLAAKPANAGERVAKLTMNLSKPSDQIEKVLQAHRKGYDAAKADRERGHALFTKNCSICHQIDGQGAVVGPQLDGIGNRGLERLTEDILDPNRNVDRGFRTQILVLKDGDVVSGLPRREQGELVVFADSTGKEISVPVKNIAQRRESETSLMPENFADVLTTQEFNDLMSFLLSRVPKR